MATLRRESATAPRHISESKAKLAANPDRGQVQNKIIHTCKDREKQAMFMLDTTELKCQLAELKVEFLECTFHVVTIHCRS